IWRYTRAQNAEMDFPAPAAPTALDTDNDGFADTVYMGDMGGNMWRFRLCPSDVTGCGAASYPSDCSDANWTGSLLFRSTSAERGPASTSKQIFTQAVVTKDPAKYFWVYWGTGENNDPITRPDDSNDTKNRIYAVKENKEFTGTYTTANLKNITSGVYCYSAQTEGCTIADSQNGWYINLSTNPLTISGPGGYTINNPVGEKMISDPALFGGMLMFPTYLPQQGEDTACGQAGHSFLYKLDYLTGSGKADEGRRTDYIGVGVGSSVLVSYRPGFGAADIYATASGGAGTSALTQQLGEAPSTSSMTNILYWKDRRLK
ncbi:MAG TPA: PilC/PilY family type IV pilus protein, partial [Smithellaceae bacterium]|nr:PilC/PilY family type IV pilus protein [Smithellaceae bacterium]